MIEITLQCENTTLHAGDFCTLQDEFVQVVRRVEVPDPEPEWKPGHVLELTNSASSGCWFRAGGWRWNEKQKWINSGGSVIDDSVISNYWSRGLITIVRTPE